MTRRLRSLLGRRSSWTRQAVVAVVALVLLSVVASALTPPPRSRQPSRPKTVGASSPASTGSGRFAPHASMVEVARAREAAARFLERYLPFVYGRASASSVAP